MPEYEVYPIEIAGIRRELRKFEVGPGVTIAILNLLGDTELVEAAGTELAARLAAHQPDVLVTAEAKSIPLTHVISARMNNLPYVVLRKSHKPYMGDALKSETLSITTGKPQELYLDEKDFDLIADKRVVLVDDVISTGSTLQGMRLIVNKAGGEIIAESAVLTEGDRAKWQDIVALGHLPVWIADNDS